MYWPGQRTKKEIYLFIYLFILGGEGDFSLYRRFECHLGVEYQWQKKNRSNVTDGGSWKCGIGKGRASIR